MADFVHLNVHTHYSILMGLCHIPPLVERASALKMDTLAITDTANMFASFEFYKACKKEGVRPIVGMSVFIAEDMHEHKAQDGVRIGRRLLLFARNHEGYKTLCRLSSYGYTEGFYFKPRIDRELLKKHSEGLLILSGGMGSEINSLLDMGKEDKAKEGVEFYRNLVGPENYFIEIQRTGIPELEEVEAKLVSFAKEMGVPCVATNDVYYINQDDSLSQEILMCVGQQKMLSDASRPRFSTHEFYLKSPDEMAELFKDMPEAIENTLKVADLCQLEFPPMEYHLPLISPPSQMTMEQYFDELCIKGLKKRYGEDLSEKVLSRYKMEKGVILRTGFPTYFIIVADFIAKAREMGIPVGPGRGSAAGSIIAYALEITDIEPLRFDLLFERFLNEERVSMPDIDIDFCQERRKEVIQYVVNHYGRDNVAMIATFGTMGVKGVVRDVGRVLGVEVAEVNLICKMIPDTPKVTIKASFEANHELRDYARTDKNAIEIFKLAKKLEGTVRNVGTHAAGVVIADRDLKDYLPLYQSDETISTQFTMTSVEEDCGLLKMDFLGLQNLTVIEKAVQTIEKSRGIKINIRELELDDPGTYELLQRGDTMGVFQFESEGMRGLLKKAKPDIFEDVIALLALYRPGPLGSGMDKVFVECKHGRQEIAYAHPLCESELSETYGVILYQEQVMRLANKLAGFSLKEADSLRKAMGKKKAEIMNKFKSKFVDGSVGNGIPSDVAEDIWELMAKFAEYGFNKSHSTAYAYVSYQTAWLKHHYPEEFMAALMTCDIRNKDKIAVLREECRKINIEVLPPHINQSSFDFRVVDKAIRYGLGGAKGVGAPAVQAIVESRQEKGLYKTFDEFIERVDLSRCGKTAIDALIKCGALDGLNANRCQMSEGLVESMQMAQGEMKKKGQGQMMLFAVEDPLPGNQALPDLKEWPEADLLVKEKEILGFYVSSHPLASVSRDLEYFSSHKLLELGNIEENSEVCIGGLLTECSHRFYRENKKMFRFQLEDLSKSVDCVYFCPENDRYGHLLQDDSIVYIVGRVSRGRGDEPGLKASMIIPMSEVERSLSGSLNLHLEEEHLEEGFVRKLSGLLGQYRGKVPVYATFEGNSDKIVQMKLDQGHSVTPEKSLLLSLDEMLGEGHVEIRKHTKELLSSRRW